MRTDAHLSVKKKTKEKTNNIYDEHYSVLRVELEVEKLRHAGNCQSAVSSHDGTLSYARVPSLLLYVCVCVCV